MNLARNVPKTLLTGWLICLCLGLGVGLGKPALATAPAPLFLIDSPFDPPALTRIYAVDPATGALSLRADLGSTYTPSLALAAASESVLYAGATDPTGTLCQGSSCLLLKVTLDPLSTVPQSITVVGPFHEGAMAIGEITGLTFRSDGSLYALSQTNSGIYIVDPATASATLVGISNVDLHGGDITFDADDHLWVWTNTPPSGLYEVDPATASTTPVDLTPPDTCAGLAALGHSNVLYAASSANDSLHEFQAGVGSTGAIVPLTLDGSPFDHKRGDLDSPACLTGPFCDDADACTDDSCEPGGCRHVRRANCCLTAADCDDHDPCTADACTGGAGNDLPPGGGESSDRAAADASATCAHAPITGGETTCGEGVCRRAAIACVAGAPQSCQPGLPSTETCNGLDDDCDGATDEDVAAPTAVPAVSLSGGSATILSWTAVPGAFDYQAVQGDLGVLVSSHGSFAAAVTSCLGAHLTATSIGVPGVPPAGGGVWYLVRPASCSNRGTWDEPGPHQVAPRDALIGSALAACP